MERGSVSKIEISFDGIELQGDLHIPATAKGIVLFAHGSGSSRWSPRNRFVAQTLEGNGLATLLFDLLTEEEERIDTITGEFRFDIPLLADRVVRATEWLKENGSTRGLCIGYFGASTGAAAALIAAAKHPHDLFAIVSRGGRPDLAREELRNVQAPTLLIVGGEDTPVIEMNREAARLLQVEHRLEIVPGATHLFEEAGKLEVVARLAADWFCRFLPHGEDR